MKKHLLYGGCAVVGMVVLLLDGESALSGASEGVALCLKTVIPSLFPFIFLSGMVVASFQSSDSALLGRAGSLLKMPKGSEALLIPAILGGYPVGAQNIAQAYNRKMIPKKSAEKLLAFCSNAGPSFIFGILSGKFSRKQDVWMIWIVQLLSIYSAACFFSAEGQCSTLQAGSEFSPAQCLDSAITASGKICGWIVLFRTAMSVLEKHLGRFLPEFCKPVFYGVLELTNGCCILDQIADERFRFIACSVLLSFGGLCVLGQTAAVCTGLKLRGYLLGKLTQAGASLLYASCLQFRSWFLIPLLLFFLHRYARKKQWKSGSDRCIISSETFGGRCYAVSKKNRTLLCLLHTWSQN